MKKLLLLLLLPIAVSAAEVAGVKIDDKARIGGADLALNGVELREVLEDGRRDRHSSPALRKLKHSPSETMR